MDESARPCVEVIPINDWIKKAREGDAEAFVALMRTQEQSLYKIARSFFQSPMDVEDAVSQTVLDCWEQIGALRKPAYFRTWLTRILINNCKDIIRGRSRLVVLSELPEREPLEDDHSGLYFGELIDMLPENCRPVMQLYYGEGFKAREIAELLDIPVGTVTVRLKRGRERLEARLRKGEAEA